MVTWKNCACVYSTCVCVCVWQTQRASYRSSVFFCVVYLCIDRPSSSLCDYRSISPQIACDLSEWARFSEGWQFSENCHGISLNPHSSISFSSPSHSLSLTHIHIRMYTHTSVQTQMQHPNGKPWLLILRSAPPRSQAFLSLLQHRTDKRRPLLLMMSSETQKNVNS